MKQFLKFLTIWISQNLSIPFGMIGHVHLNIKRLKRHTLDFSQLRYEYYSINWLYYKQK